MLYIISFSHSQLYFGRHRVCMIDFASVTFPVEVIRSVKLTFHLLELIYLRSRVFWIIDFATVSFNVRDICSI